MASKEGLTRQATAFIESCEFDQLPADAIRVGRRCILDGLGLMVAGAEEPAVQILKRDALDQAGKPEALLLGAGKSRVPASMAAASSGRPDTRMTGMTPRSRAIRVTFMAC